MKHRRRWSLRGRMAFIAAIAIAAIAVSVCSVAWLALRQTVLDQADLELQTISLGPIGRVDPRTLQRSSSSALTDPGQLYLQLVLADGRTYVPPDQGRRLPVTAADRSVVAGADSHVRYTTELPDGRFRVLTVQGANGGAVQLARSLRDADAAVHRVGVLMAVLAAGAVGAAAVAGRIVARTGLQPIERLTATASTVAATQELGQPIAVAGDDEVARLGRAFNQMLAALDGSRRAQQRLVDDVAHELRTPMTSLGMNVELLLRADDRLTTDDRHALLNDLRTQSRELGQLVTELLGLARLEATPEPAVPLDLADVLRAAVERVQARARHVTIVGDVRPIPMVGRPAALERMAINLLDNAVKFGGPHQPVELSATIAGRGGEPARAIVCVADHGPGIPRDERDRVFQRFYRAATARPTVGSGLGLAIVHQVVTAHRGRVDIDERPGGGALVRVVLPVEPANLRSS